MAIATIWYQREINAIFKFYPDIKAIQRKCNKSAYKIDRKAEELGIIKLTHKPIPALKKVVDNSCKLWSRKSRSIEEIEADINLLETKISNGIDLGSEWNKTIDKYNALLVEYELAVKTQKI